MLFQSLDGGVGGKRRGGRQAVGGCTYGEVHLLDGQLQVFESHSHYVLSVIQVAEVSHDNFCTLLQIHSEICVLVFLFPFLNFYR